MAKKPTYEELDQKVKSLEKELQDRMGVEGALKESEEHYRLIVDESPGAIMAIRNGCFLFVNPAAARMLGFSNHEEMVGIPALDVVAPDSQREVAERIKNLESGEGNPAVEIELVRRDGSKIIAETISISTLLQGKPTGVIIAHDITERKRIQERQLESEVKYRTLIEHAPDGIFLVDATTGLFLDCNPQGLKMFGYSREKMLSFTPVDFSPPVAPDGRPVPEVLQERLESLIPEKQIVFEWVHLHADGHEIPCEIRAVLLPSEDRRILRASMIDITNRKRTEEAFEERSRFQELIARISTKFVGLSGVKFEQAIQDALAEIGRYFDVETVRLYRLSPQGDVLKIRNMWRAEHLAPEEEMPEIHQMKYPNLASHYSRGESVVFGRFEDSPEWPEMRKILEFFGTKAGVGVPLEIDNSGVDIFAMDKVLSEHVWPKDIVEHSRAIGQVILSAMRRREAEIELQDSFDEIKQLKKRLEQENIFLRQEIEIQFRHDEIVGDSDTMEGVLKQAEMVAKQDTSILILGETGTGKELLARAIHNISPRKNRAMIKVNCAALPATLIESELFGREKGAFTGALSRQVGRFEAADGSTIFLDEIGDLPLEMQAKLLRVLHDGQFERLGSAESVFADVRVIAATNHNLEQEMREGRFRQDLYYRLSVFPITVPPLRERREDIPLLAWSFVREFGESMGKSISEISKKDMDTLKSYFWPGNVRELKNIIERAMILSTGATLHLDPMSSGDVEAMHSMTLEGVEKSHILEVVESTGWKISGRNGAAEVLGLKESTLRARMKKLGIQRKK